MAKDKKPKYRSVLGVDPGDTTGWAVVRTSTESAADVPEVVACGQISGIPVKQALELADTLSFYGFHEPGRLGLVIEDFQVRTMSVRLSPVQVGYALLGVLAERFGSAVQPVWQMPSMAKTTATDDRLKRWGLWQSGKPHANDAIRHGVVALRRAARDPKVADQLKPG